MSGRWLSAKSVALWLSELCKRRGVHDTVLGFCSQAPPPHLASCVCVCVCGLVRVVMQVLHVGSKSCFIPFTSLPRPLASLSVDGFRRKIFPSTLDFFLRLTRFFIRLTHVLPHSHRCFAHSGQDRKKSFYSAAIDVGQLQWKWQSTVFLI